MTEIHGGPHTLYGWGPAREFRSWRPAGQRRKCSPKIRADRRATAGRSTRRTSATGPRPDAPASSPGSEALVHRRTADPERLGVTGGSYGGYLTNWIVAHDQRFRAAITCRSVSDMAMLFLTGDISGGESGARSSAPRRGRDQASYRQISPLDATPTGSGRRSLFSAREDLRGADRAGRGPVHGPPLRSPAGTTHAGARTEPRELTRSGTPFRRVRGLVRVRDWFRPLSGRPANGAPCRPWPRQESRRAGGNLGRPWRPRRATWPRSLSEREPNDRQGLGPAARPPREPAGAGDRRSTRSASRSGSTRSRSARSRRPRSCGRSTSRSG